MDQRRNQKVFWTQWKWNTAYKNFSQRFFFLIWEKEVFYNFGTRVSFVQGLSPNNFWFGPVALSVLRLDHWVYKAGVKGT